MNYSGLNKVLQGLTVQPSYQDSRGDSRSITQRWAGNKPFATQPYAILGCDGLVIAIRAYPAPLPASTHIIPIPPDLPVTPGWRFNGKDFHQ